MEDEFNLKNLSFKDYGFKIGNIPGFSLPVDIVAIFQRMLLSKEKSLSFEISLSSYEGFKDILKENFKQKLTRRSMIKIFNNLGLGEFIFSVFDIKNKVIQIKNLNNPFPERYKFLFGLQKSPMCLHTSGIFRAMFEEFLFTSNLNIKELYCKSQGKPFCLFEITW